MAMGRRGRGAAGGGGGAQCAYPVLAAAPRRMGTTVSRCAVALRRTAAGPAGGLRTRAHARGGAGGRRPAVAGAGVLAGAPWAAFGRRTGVGVRSARARAPARRRRGNSRPCCRGPEAGRGEHTVAPPRGGRRRGGRRSGERPRGRTSTAVRAQPRAMRGGVCSREPRQHKQLQDLDRTANFDKTAVHLHGTEASPSRSLSQGRTAARPTKGAQGGQARVCALG